MFRRDAVGAGFEIKTDVGGQARKTASV
jgi:hypothetical protein